MAPGGATGASSCGDAMKQLLGRLLRAEDSYAIDGFADGTTSKVTLNDYREGMTAHSMIRRVSVNGRNVPVSSVGDPFAAFFRNCMRQVKKQKERTLENEKRNTVFRIRDLAKMKRQDRTNYKREGALVKRNTEDAMQIVRNANGAMNTILNVKNMTLEPFQYDYMRRWTTNLFNKWTIRHANTFLPELVQMVGLATPKMKWYDFSVPDSAVAMEMKATWKDLSKFMIRMSCPRRSGKSVAIDLSVALELVFFESDTNLVVLVGHQLDSSRAHLRDVEKNLQILKDAGIGGIERIMVNDREVNVKLKDGRFSTFRIISGTEHVSNPFIIYRFYRLSKKR